LENPYLILGVPEDASDAQIGQRFRELALGLHPDVAQTDGSERFKRVAAVYNCLKSPQAREETDAKLREERRCVMEAQDQPSEPMPPAKPARRRRRRKRAAGLRSPLLNRPRAIMVKRRPPPTPFMDLASLIARTRPAPEAPWLLFLGAAADIWLATRRR
jgi:curved DNA-binding protein CbpA